MDDVFLPLFHFPFSFLVCVAWLCYVRANLIIKTNCIRCLILLLFYTCANWIIIVIDELLQHG
jgi:hypothetical protein